MVAFTGRFPAAAKRPFGLVVKASASRAADPGFDSVGIFAGPVVPVT